ncbi:antitoxin Xre/MbcA/ParS toxin-binding domain-containing protein [Pseudomonas sp. PWP3-1b2]
MACELHGGDMRAAADWLQTPLPAIGNLAPIDIKDVGPAAPEKCDR